MHCLAHQNYPAVFYVLFHGPSQGALCFLAELIRLVDDQYFEAFAVLGLHGSCLRNFLDNMLYNVSVVTLAVSWTDFNVMITLQNIVLDTCAAIGQFEHSFLAAKFVNRGAEYLSDEGLSSGFFACS